MSPTAFLSPVNQCQITEFQRVGDSLNPDHPDACVKFSGHVQRLQAAVINSYELVAYEALQKKEPAEAAELWKEMVDFCDKAIEAIRLKKDQYPDCGTPALYDLALDYRNASHERYQENKEDAECASKEIPTGLFPKES